MQDMFHKMVMEHFQFLVDDYGFTIAKIDDHFQYDPNLEGYVEYVSPATSVQVVGEWYFNGVRFGRVKDDKEFSLSSEQVYRFLSLTAEEKEIICSPDPKHSRDADAVFYSKSLNHEKREFGSRADETNSQLVDHARWLRQYAEPFLHGDFSRWLEIHEFHVSARLAEAIRSGKADTIMRYSGKDENGKSTYKKELVIQPSLDYLELLRRGE